MYDLNMSLFPFWGEDRNTKGENKNFSIIGL